MNTNVDILKERATTLLREGKGVLEQMNEISEWGSLGDMIKNVSTLSAYVQNVVMAVEVTTSEAIDDIEDLKSEDKLEAAAVIIDDAIKLPWWLEKIDGPIINLVISLAVDYINKKYGNEWNLDAARDAIKNGTEMVSKVTESI